MTAMTEGDSEFANLQSNGVTGAKICKGLGKGRRRDSEKPLGERRKAVFRQTLMVLLGNTGVLGAGMSVALPSVTLTQLTDPNESFHLSSDEASWYSSINTMASPVGGLIVGYLMDRLGRKWTMLLTNIAGVIGWCLLSTASLHSTKSAIYTQILLARIFSGIMIGLCISPVGVYSAEISLPRIRGRLILFTSMGIASGILVMYILGYFIRGDWQLISIISCVYQFISLLCVFSLPESPSWLLLRGYDERARKALKYFRGLNKKDTSYCEQFEEELAQMKKNSEISRETSANETSLWSTLKAPEVYKPMVLMIGFFVFQQMSGVVVVVVFAVQIASQAGVTSDPVLCAVLVGLARIITTFFMSGVFERWGRKPAGIISAAGMAVCMLLLALSGWFHFNKTVQLLPVVCIILYIIFSTMGLLTLPFFMISEVFPQRVRGAASGTTVCVGLLVSFMVIKMYPSMEEAFGTAFMFACFGLVSLGAVFYIYFFIPETRGRTLVEIENYFRTGKLIADVEEPIENVSQKYENNKEVSKMISEEDRT